MKLKNNIFYSKSLNPLSYQELLSKYYPIINQDTKEYIIHKLKPIYKLRGEKLIFQ